MMTDEPEEIVHAKRLIEDMVTAVLAEDEIDQAAVAMMAPTVDPAALVRAAGSLIGGYFVAMAETMARQSASILVGHKTPTAANLWAQQVEFMRRSRGE